VLLGEAGANTAVTRRYGRGPRGKRARAAAPVWTWQTTWQALTMIAVVRPEGPFAPFAFRGVWRGRLPDRRRAGPGPGAEAGRGWGKKVGARAAEEPPREGRTDVFKDVTSNAGKSFDARLRPEAGEVRFDFGPG
jgi:hypothetical protein